MMRLAISISISLSVLSLGGCPDTSGGAAGLEELLGVTLGSESGSPGTTTEPSSSDAGESTGEPTAGESEETSAEGNGGEAEASPDVQRVVELVNAERASAGLSPLTLNAKLTAAAQGHAESMYEDSYFSHTGSDGSSVSERVSREGYSWSTVGENIAYGASSPEQVMQMWMNSSGHRANILGAGYTEIGVGIDPRGALWVQVFARPR